MDMYSLRKHFDEIFFQENSKNNTVEEIIPIPIVWENLESLAKSLTLPRYQVQISYKWLLTLDSPNEQSNSSNIDLFRLSQRAPSMPRGQWHI